VKVAVNPAKDKDGNESYLSLENAKKTLKEAKKAGLKTKVYKKTYVAKYRYKHENGNKYLAWYTKSGKFVGYINTKAAKVVK
jgi:hypothetical protein